MIEYVVDSSVAVKWALPVGELLTDAANRLLSHYVDRQVKLIVPDIFWAELTNVFWKAVQRQRCSVEQAQVAIDSLQRWPFPTIPCRHIMQQALAISIKHNRSAYDSLYLALAVETNSTFITADERLANAVAAYLPVRWLGSLY